MAKVAQVTADPVIPRCMSTQHPDNVATPFFASSTVLAGEDEVREAFYAYSHLGCDEQMWDFEGKEVDVLVVEKLLSTYPEYFRAVPLGEAVRLTPRVPNPVLEPTQAKGLLEVLHSLPRHADIARLFYGRERPPVVELIFPMTTSAAELERVRRYYERFVAGLADEVLAPGDGRLAEWFGEFEPKTVRVIPLIEDRPSMWSADTIVGDYLRDKRLDYQRVFIARSDPALNYGMFAATLLALRALDRLDRLEASAGIPIYAIVGCGGAPFRGGLRPDRVPRCLATYPSAQTFTIQSAFKYDYPANVVMAGVAELRAAPRRSPLRVAEDERLASIVDRTAARYRLEVASLAPLANAVARHVPRRRRRKLHVGLFGYSRSAGGVQLPRAIAFCAALYSVGLPPEVLGAAALSDEDWDYLNAVAPGAVADLIDAARYLDVDVQDELSLPVRESIAAVLARFGADTDAEHCALAGAMRKQLREGTMHGLADLIARAGALRRFLG